MKTVVKWFAIVQAISNFISIAYAQEPTKTINAMPVGYLFSFFEYDSGGVPLVGFIFSWTTKPPQDTDNVAFIVCNTWKTIHAAFKKLHPVNGPCPAVSSPTSLNKPFWTAWKSESGTIVATQKPNLVFVDKSKTKIDEYKLQDIRMSDLPDEYKYLAAPDKQGKDVAITFASENGDPVFGILEKKGM